MADTGTTQTTPLESLLESYRPLAVATDELIGAQGSVRPAWHGLLDAFATFPQSELRHRVHRAQQYLQDAGVFFRAYGPDGSEPRDWPLSHVPVILSGEDWRQIEAGVIQRADLLEAVAADLYGPARLVSEGHLPAALVARMQEWLRPMVGIQPRSGHFLHFLAFEIGRGPDGKWWVLGDRTQAPSGAGFAIENRIAMSRMLPEFFGAGQIARLGGFFQDFRRSLERMCGPFGGRIGVLTPGQLNDGYFEHAYIARYLGFILLEGDDIIVRGNRVMVRTVEGLQPIDVIWRRLDALYSDPVELIETSRLGTPGLVGVLRRQGVSLVNALGSGVLETRAMLAFLPRICEAVLGEPLKIPNIATWWCGQPTEREHVKDNVERMMIGPALATRLPFDADEATVLGSRFREGARSSVV
ncbi:MAG: circularly permuted type 2 ATP-grasp protein, partial [Pseudomonadota bacterium]